MLSLPASTGFVTSGTQTRNTDAATYNIGQNNPTYNLQAIMH